MFARIEVALKPDFIDAPAQGLLRRLELAHPEIRKKIRWARLLETFWIDIPISREELIPAITDVCWDRVLQWVFTGNLMPSATGKSGGLQDLMEAAPNRPGKFWGIERKFRAGTTDHCGKTLKEAFEIVLGKSIPEARASSGGLLLLEGPELNEDWLAVIARDVFCNELIETWTLVSEESLKKNDRFHQERIKYDLPRVPLRSSSQVETFRLGDLSDADLEKLSQQKLWALNLKELQAIRAYFMDPQVIERRSGIGLSDPTDAEMEILAQTWSEHCKHKIFNAQIEYEEAGKSLIPKTIDGLFQSTIAGTTAEIPKPWLLSVFSDNAGICAFDEEDAFCMKVETHNSPSALDPYGGALTGIVGVNRDILGCGLGAKPIFNTNVFCVAPPDYSKGLPDQIFHPRRILDGIRRGVEHGGNKSGIPTLNGALVFDERYLGKPLVYCGTAGFMPKRSAGVECQTKQVLPGDHICMVGGRIGKDGIHGATFSSLALDAQAPSSAVQLGDPITQKRMADFLLEARDRGLYRAITDNGAGGLSSSVGEMAKLSGGAKMDVSRAKTKYPGLKPFELIVSESQERMTVAVPVVHVSEFFDLAFARGVEVSDLGEFTDSGRFEITYEDQRVAYLDLDFLHEGVPRLELKARWTPPAQWVSEGSSREMKPFDSSSEEGGAQVLLGLLGRPNIASKEWLIRQYDHEVQGTSVIKPLHTVGLGTPQSSSGPNDGGVIKPKATSNAGISVGSGVHPHLSEIDPYLMAQASVDEAIRNVLCVGAEYGLPESVLALVDNFCWPDPVGDPLKTAWLVRACYGLREACLALSVPLISGKDSMKNDFRGFRDSEPVHISVPPTLLMTAVAKVADITQARSADFKSVGNVIFVLGEANFGLLGSEFQAHLSPAPLSGFGSLRVGLPSWKMARRIYSWLGGASGRLTSKLKSLHDVSDGGLLTAVAESCLARGLGASLEFPPDCNPWEYAFGEGFHTFIASAAAEDVQALESEWDDLGIPYRRLGVIQAKDSLEVNLGMKDPGSASSAALRVEVQALRSAWVKQGYWE
ncbi:MAG: phosphoribosylformylglycinamidine synthase subunit PurL [Bdellovibrionia bacterium]